MNAGKSLEPKLSEILGIAGQAFLILEVGIEGAQRLHACGTRRVEHLAGEPQAFPALGRMLGAYIVDVVFEPQRKARDTGRSLGDFQCPKSSPGRFNARDQIHFSFLSMVFQRLPHGAVHLDHFRWVLRLGKQ